MQYLKTGITIYVTKVVYTKKHTRALRQWPRNGAIVWKPWLRISTIWAYRSSLSWNQTRSSESDLDFLPRGAWNNRSLSTRKDVKYGRRKVSFTVGAHVITSIASIQPCLPACALRSHRAKSKNICRAERRTGSKKERPIIPRLSMLLGKQCLVALYIRYD